MTFFEKAKDKAEQLIGGAEEKVGRMLGHEELENAGKRDLLTGEVKEAGHDLRDGTAAGAVDDETAGDDETAVGDDTPMGAADDTKDKVSGDDK